MQNPKIRSIVFFAILSLGLGLAALLHFTRVKAPMGPTLAPLLQTAGQVPQGMDRLLTKVVAVNDLDEKELGLSMRESIEREIVEHKNVVNGNLLYLLLSSEVEPAYLEELSKKIQSSAKKPFNYLILEYPSFSHNAIALPGGTIVLTMALLSFVVESEAQLFAILAHEMAHIELGHCMNTVKFQLAAQKIKATKLGKIADLGMHLLAKHAFSKTQEDEADAYAFDLLLESQYDPRALAEIFENLSKASDHSNEQNFNPFRDYLASHPPLALRIEKYAKKADEWWRKNPDAVRYSGKQNWVNKTVLSPQNSYESDRVIISN
ncbi:MAG: M48 family metallopeptidase [Bradymonadales bacterium]